jgi:hypothetical protein
MSSATTSASDTNQTSSSNLIKNILNKPVISGITGALLDKYVMGVPDTMSNVRFGATVFLGTVASSTVASFASSAMPTMESNYLYNGQTLTQRSIEVAAGSGISFLLNKYLLKNDVYDGNNWYKRVGVIALSQVIAEYATDIMQGSQPSYLM